MLNKIFCINQKISIFVLNLKSIIRIKNALINYKNRTGVKLMTKRNPISITREQIDYYLAIPGMSQRKMAKELGVNRGTLRRAFAYCGIKSLSKSKIPPKEQIEDLLYNQFWTITQMATHFNVNINSMSIYLRKYMLPTPDQYNREFFKNKVVLDYFRFNSMKTIGKKYEQFSHRRVKSMLNNVGIDTSLDFKELLFKMRMAAWKPISNNLLEILNGEYLGDGSSRLTGKNEGILPHETQYINAIDNLLLLSKIDKLSNLPNFVEMFNHSRKTLTGFQTATFRLSKHVYETPWVNYIGEILKSEGYPCHIITLVQNREDVPYPVIYLDSSSSFQLAHLRKKWYPDGKKLVPRDLILTPRTLLHWYIGDGGVSSELYLHTQSFPLVDVNFLKYLLEHELDIEVRLKERPDKPKLYYLTIPIRYFDSFLDYLESDSDLKDSLSNARRFFAWKFDSKLRKKDYLPTLLEILAQIS